MNQREKDQRDYVRGLLSSCSQWKMKKEAGLDADPPATVLKARAVIARHEKQQNRKGERIEKTYSRLCAAVRREIYFGSMKKALAMAEALLRRCGE